MSEVNWSMGFMDDEKAELLELLKDSPKWTKRIQEAHGGVVNMSFTSNSVNIHSMFHDYSLMGKRVKVVRGDCEVSIPTCLGRMGVITGWYDFEDANPDKGFSCILPASCYHMAIVTEDDGKTFRANTSWCDVIADDSYHQPPHPGWVLTNRDRSYYHTTGIYRWVPPGDPAIEPCRIGEEGHAGISASYRDGTSHQLHL